MLLGRRTNSFSVGISKKTDAPKSKLIMQISSIIKGAEFNVKNLKVEGELVGSFFVKVVKSLVNSHAN